MNMVRQGLIIFFLSKLLLLINSLSLAQAHPAVHVLMPYYNAAGLIEGSIASFLSQDYDNISLIAYNDSSTDSSLESILFYQKQYPVKIIALNGPENFGIARARDFVFKYSQSLDPNAIRLWLDADDSFTDSEFISKLARKFAQTGADIVLYGFEIALEQENQRSNSEGLFKDKQKSDSILDKISSMPEGTNIDSCDLLSISTLGWIKAYSGSQNLPSPDLDMNYEDFVYMLALVNAQKVVSFPSSYQPIRYLRRENSITGQRKAADFMNVLGQLECFVEGLKSEQILKNKAKICMFLESKKDQYRNLMVQLMDNKTEGFNNNLLEEFDAKYSEIQARIDL